MAKETSLLPGPPPAPTFKEALKEDKAQFDDCTPCRVVGSAAFIGLGIYTYVSGHSQLKAQESVIKASGSRFGMAPRRVGLTGMAAGLVGLGVYRWFA
ncbi:uncharacterized protein EI97DRAFT_434523 [Westerdykella ornata]|uniref:Distal membrane-arm assembly complex protein 1-like domain-containing protein n=1 Tax=Westerdykella ornata TaxID=318751 RepID=A0A6A6JFA5_WESOR|nr:uncharacterized protein EI97DRAFT_434523 [Westerdykella ornata]KAF2274955.1 hypothetical protein EI97DRAFT_434523 [Westerdykella ornata]